MDDIEIGAAIKIKNDLNTAFKPFFVVGVVLLDLPANVITAGFWNSDKRCLLIFLLQF